MRFSYRFPLIMFLGAHLLSANVQADNASLQETIVTDRQYRPTTQGVFSHVVSGSTLSRFGVGDLTASSRYFPGLLVIQSRTGITESVGIRGVSPNFRREVEQSVGLMIDGVPYQRSEIYKTSFLDIADVEVLKGPQATLFAENATTGAIRIRTNDPTADLESRLTVRRGSFDETIVGGVISGPLTSKLKARLALQHDERDGFFSNSLGPDGVGTEEDNARLKLFYQLSAATRLKLTGEYLHSEGEGALGQINGIKGLGFFAFNPSHPSGGAPGFHPSVGLSPQDALRLFDPQIEFQLNERQSSAQLTNASDVTARNLRLSVDHEINSSLTLNYLGGYSHLEHRIQADQDRTPIPFFFNDERVDFSQQSHELTLAGRLRGVSPWVTGISYARSTHERASDFSLTLPPGGPGGFQAFADGFGTFAMIRDEWRRKKQVFSVFTELDLKLSPSLSLVLAGRWSHQDQDQDIYDAPFGGALLAPTGASIPPGFTAETFAAAVFGTSGGCFTERRFEFYEQIGLGAPCSDGLSFDDKTFAPHISFRWQATESIHAHLTWARGYKSGAYQFERLIDPERAELVELGVGFVGADDRIRGNVSLFHTKFEDRQVDSRVAQQTLLTNDAELSIEGLEVDITWAVTKPLEIYLALTVSNSAFDAYPSAPCTSDQINLLPPPLRGGCSQNLDGRRSYRSPDHELVLGFSYRHQLRSIPWSLVFSTHANFTDNYSGNSSSTLDPYNEQEAFEQVDLSLALESNDRAWSLNAFVRNVTDEIVRGGSSPVFFMPGAFFSEAGPGRTIALQLTWNGVSAN